MTEFPTITFVLGDPIPRFGDSVFNSESLTRGVFGLWWDFSHWWFKVNPRLGLHVTFSLLLFVFNCKTSYRSDDDGLYFQRNNLVELHEDIIVKAGSVDVKDISNPDVVLDLRILELLRSLLQLRFTFRYGLANL